jgi:hypothetical protein
MEPNYLLSILPKFNNQKILIKKNQNVDDIIQALKIAHNQYKKDYDKIARYFVGHNKKQTAYNIWKFLKKNIPYKAEPDTMQTIKSPAAIIKTGLMGKNSLFYNDCKNYSLFAGGILSALNRQGYNIPYVYRFASYNLFDQVPGHVFIVVNPDKNEIWLDAVLKEFDYKKQYQYKKDKNFDNMMYSISGVDDVITGRKERKVARKEKRAKRKAEGKTFGQRLAKTVKKAGKVVLKVAASPARNAFLGLVKLNFRSLATNLKKLNDKAPAKLREFWEGAGGRHQNLITAINQGSKKRRLGAEIGAEPVTTGAAAAAAAPLLIKIAEILKKAGINEEFVGDLAKKVIENKVQKVLEKTEAQTDVQEAAVEQVADDISSQESNKFMNRLANQNNVKLVNEQGQQVTTAKTGTNMNTVLLLGGVGVAALLLMKKR